METNGTKQGQHTPGEWKYSRYSQEVDDIKRIRAVGLEPTLLLGNDGAAPIMAGDKRVAMVDCQTKFKRGLGYKTECAEREANSLLIASAPDLLAALERISANAAESPEWIRRNCEEAIRRAKGQA